MVDVLIFGARAYGWASVVRYLQAGTEVGSGKWEVGRSGCFVRGFGVQCHVLVVVVVSVCLCVSLSLSV